jgi:hypothetical protein
VVARVSPEHKIRIVRALQARGDVVAMTGDGVNDAPALRRADIGVALGITGTEVTREASTMVLTDDNFATIVAAVREGRGIYDNIVKFVRFHVSTALGFVTTFLVSSPTGLAGGAPFTALQILFVNLVMDGLPAMSIEVAPFSQGAMSRPPRPTGEPILSPPRLARILLTSVVMEAPSRCWRGPQARRRNQDRPPSRPPWPLQKISSGGPDAVRRHPQSLPATASSTPASSRPRMPASLPSRPAWLLHRGRLDAPTGTGFYPLAGSTGCTCRLRLYGEAPACRRVWTYMRAEGAKAMGKRESASNVVGGIDGSPSSHAALRWAVCRADRRRCGGSGCLGAALGVRVVRARCGPHFR